jgi:hypothetical protein
MRNRHSSRTGAHPRSGSPARARRRPILRLIPRRPLAIGEERVAPHARAFSAAGIRDISAEMPTNKLWLEHTERAAWDSVEALRERLSKAESRLNALGIGVERVPQLLDLLDKAKQRFVPDAQGHQEIVLQLLARIERLQAEVDAARTIEPQQVRFVAPPARLRRDPDGPDDPQDLDDSDDLDDPDDLDDLDDLKASPRSRTAGDGFDLAGFAQALQRHAQGRQGTRDLNQLLTLAENKLDDLTELKGAALREAAVELAVLAARIYGASKAPK